MKTKQSYEALSLAGAKGLLHGIVARCHVADSVLVVFRYVKSRINPAYWRNMLKRDKRTLLRATVALHKANRRLFLQVSRGRL